MRILAPKVRTPETSIDVDAPPAAKPWISAPVRSGWGRGFRRIAVTASALLLGLASGGRGMPQSAEAARLAAGGLPARTGASVTLLADTEAPAVDAPDVVSFTEAVAGEPNPLTSMVYDLMTDDRGLAPEAWRTFRDTALVHPPSSDDLRSIRTTLLANNGEIFGPEARARVMAFLEHPSPQMRAAGHAAGERLDVGAAQTQIALARGLGSDAATRGALTMTLTAFDADPDARAVLTEALSGLDRRAVVSEALAGPVDAKVWFGEVVPNLEDLPFSWSETADEVLAARFRLADALPKPVLRSMDAFLRSRGYPVNTPRAQTLASVRDGNITRPDSTFADLMTLAGRDGHLVIGVADGGFDLRTAPLRSKNAPNTDEIPGNHVDDDGDGYVDNYDGLNLLRLAKRRMVDPAKGQGELLTGMSLGDHHGNHVTGVATRGTERLTAAMAVASSGLLGEAFDYLAKEGAQVINFSMGVTPQSLEETLAAIDRHPDVLFVHAAGNQAADVTDAAPEMSEINRHPRPNLVHVAAADEDGGRLASSNYSEAFVRLAAPAKHFSFTMADMASSARFNEGLYYYGGQTSQAAPNAGNTLAKMRLLAPELSPAQAIRLAEVTSSADARWSGLVSAGGLVAHEPALQAAALLGLVQDGQEIDAAAAQLGLDAAQRTAAKASLQKADLH